MKTIYIYAAFMFVFFMTLSYARSQEIKKDPVVFMIPTSGQVNEGMVLYLEESFCEAEEAGADIIVLNVNTYGGDLESTDDIRYLLMDSDITVWCFIDRKAVSAGSMIAMYCDKVFMTNEAIIGASTVVNSSRSVLPEKYQSFARARMRLGAELNGRNPDVAEKMVGYYEKGRMMVLTMTPGEALNLGICDKIYNSFEEMTEKELKGIDLRLPSAGLISAYSSYKNTNIESVSDDFDWSFWFSKILFILGFAIMFATNIRIKTENRVLKDAVSKMFEYLKIKKT